MTPAFEPPSVESLNDLLPAYHFVSLIASGEDEAVYVASQKSLDRHVAVKLYAPHLSELEEFSDGFQNMARQMARLNHANLIGVFNSGTVEGMHYLVMEFVPGRSMWQMFDGVPQELSKVAELIDAICDGVSHAHDHGILHGGLSVSNILINQKGEPKVGNFGYLVSVPQAMDSPWKRFVAPEVAADHGAISEVSDVYSLGVVLYELVTGQLFHPQGLVPPPAGQEKLHAVWVKATAENPGDRYAAVGEFRKACADAFPKKRAGGLQKVAAPAAGARQVTALSAGGGAPVPPAGAPAGAPVVHQVGFNWKLLRNVIIIGILVYAIYLVWNRYQNEQEARARIAAEEQALKEQERAEKRAKEAAEMAERKRLWEEQQAKLAVPEPEPEPEPVVVPPKPRDDQFESLNRLQQQLQSGERGEMPSEAVAIGPYHFMFISKAMSWPQASAFAWKYGAHLAVPGGDATLDELRGKVMSGADDEIWLGAAASGMDSWALIDGKVFKPGTAPVGDGVYLSVDGDAVLRASDTDASLPFIIQWHKDGTNPGSLERQLEVTRGSLANGMPVYPPGTHTYGVRHYLYVALEADWQHANQLAASSGGHLMVTTGVAEKFNVQRMTDAISAPGGIWIGGHGVDGRWCWVTGEEWTGGKWPGGGEPAAAGMAVLVKPGAGWHAADASSTATGFIIEWSADASE